MSLELFAYKRHAVVSKYKGEDKYVIIPQEYKGVPVTEIMAGAFANNRTLEGVFVPKTLQIIESNAFADCWNFKFISGGLEESEITDIPGMPEDEWPDLDALGEEEIPTMSIIPASVKTIADGAFKGTMIGDVDCRTESLELGESAFEDCEHMHMLALFSCKHLTIGRRTFKNSSLVRLYAPGVRMELVPEEAFCNPRFFSTSSSFCL